MARKILSQTSFPWLDFAKLGFEAQHVIWLRMMKLAAGGPTAHRESALMVSEKFLAAAMAGQQMMLGRSTGEIIGSYRKTVRANARRLLAAKSPSRARK